MQTNKISKALLGCCCPSKQGFAGSHAHSVNLVVNWVSSRLWFSSLYLPSVSSPPLPSTLVSLSHIPSLPKFSRCSFRPLSLSPGSENTKREEAEEEETVNLSRIGPVLVCEAIFLPPKREELHLIFASSSAGCVCIWGQPRWGS